VTDFSECVILQERKRAEFVALENSKRKNLHVILPRVAHEGPGVAGRDVLGDEQPGVDALDVLVCL
jgi:hypothetical protein